MQKEVMNNKKYSFMKWFYVSAVAIGLNFSVFAQKSNVVSAAVEYKKYDMAFMKGDIQEAKNILLKCKEYLDPAMEDAQTKDDPKAHYYNGKVHFGLMMLSAMSPDDDELQAFQSEETQETIENSLKFAHQNRKFKRDVEDYVNQWVSLSSAGASQAFESEDYVTAFGGFSGAYELQKIISVDDESMKNNALISARNAVIKMREAGELEDALAFIDETKTIFPKNTELAIEGVNIALEQGDIDKAEAYFNTAAEATPDNIALFTSMGSIFLGYADRLTEELKQIDVTDPSYGDKAEEAEKMYEKAEKNLIRAREIDPKDPDAAYNLGVLYLGKADKIALRAGNMDYDDPRYESTVKESEEMYKKAIDPLEVYIEQDPENAGVLHVLFQVHRKAGNTAKALEYKKRAEEAAEGQ